MRTKAILVMCILSSVLCTRAAAKVIYVDDDANGISNGTSWQNAYKYLQDALTDAKNAEKPVEIRAAQGIYKPDLGAGITHGDRNASFQMINKVSLTGGFAGLGQADPNVRDIELYETILSGDLNSNDAEDLSSRILLYEPSRAENSYRIIAANGIDETTSVDGFTVTGGNANSTSNQNGGGISTANSNMIINNCTFIENAAYRGGGLYNYFYNPQFINCKFLKNMSKDNGGGIYNDYGNPALTSCSFTGNVSRKDGGGMCNVSNSYPVLTNCTFYWNLAESDGGGIYNNGSNPIISDCLFNINMAEYHGGGMYNQNSNPACFKCIFLSNISESNGGGIYNNQSSSILSGCTFSKNVAISDGGGIYNNSNSNGALSNCIFNNNSAKNGGGINNYTNCNPSFTDCVFTENKATSNGGGMYNYNNSNPVLNNCTISRNNALSSGGGIYNTLSSNPSIKKTRFSENISSNNGGGIYNDGSSPKLMNCIFSGNRAISDGGGLFNTKSSNIIAANCIFTGNLSRNGNSICFVSSAKPSIFTMTNCILCDENTQIWNNDGSAIAISYCDIKDAQSTLFDPLGKIVWGEGVIDSDPCFAYPGYWDPNGTTGKSNDDFWVDGDYHLKSQAGRWDSQIQSRITDSVTSPCIDAGEPNNLIYYEPIPNGGRINIGVYGGTIEASKSLHDVNCLQQASYPDPNNGSTSVFLDSILSWISDPNAITQEFYFGTIEQPPFIQKQYDTIFDPGPLEPNTIYYWRIDEVDNLLNRITGNTWTFTTGFYPAKPFLPSPDNGAADVEINTTLKWSPAAYADTFTLYLGTDFNDVNAATLTNQLGVLVSPAREPNFYNPGTLAYDKLYFWRVDETDTNGLQIKGHIWSFSTVKSTPKTSGCFIGQTPAWVDGKAVSISTISAGQYSSKIDKVEQLLIHEGTFTMYDILLESGDCITVADEHYFMVESGKWISSKKLESGMKLRTVKGLIKIKSVTKQPEQFTGKVYNLKIKNSDSYMVGKDAVIVRDY